MEKSKKEMKIICPLCHGISVIAYGSRADPPQTGLYSRIVMMCTDCGASRSYFGEAIKNLLEELRWIKERDMDIEWDFLSSPRTILPDKKHDS
jgi:C4-type Zn-finger protein